MRRTTCKNCGSLLRGRYAKTDFCCDGCVGMWKIKEEKRQRREAQRAKLSDDINEAIDKINAGRATKEDAMEWLWEGYGWASSEIEEFISRYVE